MRYLKLTIAYDGTDFHGWQIQKDKPTVQGEIGRRSAPHYAEQIHLHGSGRTDAGVHALGQVGSFQTQSTLSAGEFQRALNAILPPTIRIMEADETGPDFNARWSARAKIYRYRHLSRKSCSAERVALRPPLSLSARRRQHARSRGKIRRHARLCFVRWRPLAPKMTTKNAAPNAKSFQQTSFAARTTKSFVFTVRGRSFLRYMVRKMVGTLLDVGRGRLQPDDIEKLFALRDRLQIWPHRSSARPLHGKSRTRRGLASRQAVALLAT